MSYNHHLYTPLELKHIKHEEYYSPTDLYMESALVSVVYTVWGALVVLKWHENAKFAFLETY